MTPFDEEIRETQMWIESPRFERTTRLYTARQVVEQRHPVVERFSGVAWRLGHAGKYRPRSGSDPQSHDSRYGARNSRATSPRAR